jgi:hypothetical protein
LDMLCDDLEGNDVEDVPYIKYTFRWTFLKLFNIKDINELLFLISPSILLFVYCISIYVCVFIFSLFCFIIIPECSKWKKIKRKTVLFSLNYSNGYTKDAHDGTCARNEKSVLETKWTLSTSSSLCTLPGTPESAVRKFRRAHLSGSHSNILHFVKNCIS